MNITLVPDHEDFIRRCIDDGLYESESQVVWDALRLLRDCLSSDQKKLEYLRLAIQQGLESGEPEPFDVEAILTEANLRHTQHQMRR